MFICRFWIAQHVQLTELYIFYYDDIPGKLLERFDTAVNVGVLCCFCCMSVEKKKCTQLTKPYNFHYDSVP